MSIAEMSATLRKEILARLKEQYASTSGRSADARLASYVDYTSSARIRSDTDSGKRGHEAVMSRGAFNILANDISKELANSSLKSIASQSLSSDITFEAFKTYLIEKTGYVKGKARNAGGFTYTGASRVGQDSGLTIATENLPNNESSDRDVLILRNTPIGNLVNYYVDFLSTKVIASSGYSKKDMEKELRSMFNSGHLTGVFNARLVRALGLRKDPSGNIRFDVSNSDAIASKAEIELNKIMSLLTDADYLSSNIINDVGLFVTTDKRLYKNKVNLKLTTEVQFAKSNQDVGALLKQAGAAVSDLTKSVKEGVSQSGQEAAVEKSLVRLYSNLQDLAKVVREKALQYKTLGTRLNKEAQEHLDKVLANEQAIQAIISSPGSRSIPQHITHLVSSILNRVQVQEEVSKAAVSDRLFKTIPAKVTKAKIQIPKTKKLTTNTVSTGGVSIKTPSYTLTSLQALLDKHLQDVVSANMGNGSDRRVLNYRTGRLAASAKVERLTQSRDGFVTAYYTYMKNPYATFSEGGRQQYPKSRDPKLLISKSIREIAETVAVNRMRAVVI